MDSMDWRRYGVHRTAPAFQKQPHNLSPGNATVHMVAKPILRPRSPLVARISMVLE